MQRILSRLEACLRNPWMWMAILGILICAAYSNSLLNQFLLDDHIDLFGPSGVANKSYTTILTQHQGKFFRPLGPLFYRTCFVFFQSNPLGYHVANLVLYLLVVFMIFRIVFKLFGEQDIAILASFLFGLHPIHTMLVNYTVASAISTYVLMLQLAFYCYLLFSESKKKSYLGLSFLFFLLSLLSHEMGLMFPVYIAVFLYFLKRKSFWGTLKSMSPFVLIGGAYLIVRVLFFEINTSPRGILMFFPRIDLYFLSLSRLFFWYLSKLVVPHNIIFLWSDSLAYDLVFPKGQPQILFPGSFNALGILPLSLFFVALSLLLGVIFKTKQTVVSFSLSFMLVGLLPAAYSCFNYFPQVKPMIEPHWFYFSSMGFFILLAFTLTKIKTIIHPFYRYLLIVSLLVVYYVSAQNHNRQWQNQDAYCSYWISLNKNNNTPFRGLAYSSLEQGDFERAVLHFEESFQASHDVNARMFSAYAYALYFSGQTEKGVQNLFQALKMDPHYAPSHFYLGQILLVEGDLLGAKNAYINAVKCNPQNAEYPKYVRMVSQMLLSPGD